MDLFYTETLQNRFYDPPTRDRGEADMCWPDTIGPKAPEVPVDQMCTVESCVSGGVVASTFTVKGSARKRQRYQSTRCAQSRAGSAAGWWHLHSQSTDATEPYEVSV